MGATFAVGTRVLAEASCGVDVGSVADAAVGVEVGTEAEGANGSDLDGDAADPLHPTSTRTVNAADKQAKETRFMSSGTRNLLSENLGDQWRLVRLCT